MTRLGRALLLECDGRFTAKWRYGDPIAEHLRRCGFVVDRRGIHDRWSVQSDHDIAVISGGLTAVSATSGWMPARLDDLRVIVGPSSTESTPVLGVCLGAQMLAEVIGGTGTVGPAASAAAGVGRIHFADGSDHDVARFNYHRINREKVSAAGAEVLATSEPNSVEMMRWKDRVVGVQFHIDLDADGLAEVLRYNASTLERHHIDLAAALNTVTGAGGTLGVAPWWLLDDVWPYLSLDPPIR